MSPVLGLGDCPVASSHFSNFTDTQTAWGPAGWWDWPGSLDFLVVVSRPEPLSLCMFFLPDHTASLWLGFKFIAASLKRSLQRAPTAPAEDRPIPGSDGVAAGWGAS